VQPVTSALPIPVAHARTPVSSRYLSLTPAVKVLYSLLSQDVVSHGSHETTPRLLGPIARGSLSLVLLGEPTTIDKRSRLTGLHPRDGLSGPRVLGIRERMPSCRRGDGIPRRMLRREVTDGWVVDTEGEDAGKGKRSVLGFVSIRPGAKLTCRYTVQTCEVREEASVSLPCSVVSWPEEEHPRLRSREHTIISLSNTYQQLATRHSPQSTTPTTLKSCTSTLASYQFSFISTTNLQTFLKSIPLPSGVLT